MSTPEHTEAIVAELVGGLQPTRPLPRLRTVGLALIALASGVGFGLVLAFRPEDAELHARNLVLLGGHLLLAVGALTAALASCVPGREQTTRAGSRLAMVGVGLTLLIAAVIAAANGALVAPTLVDFRAGLRCVMTACTFGLIPALASAVFVGMAYPQRPIRTLFLTSVAVLGFATLPVHVGCPFPGPLHLVCTHATAPLTGALIMVVLMLPVYWFSSRISAGRSA